MFLAPYVLGTASSSKTEWKTMSEQEKLKSLMKPLIVFANSGGKESSPPTGEGPQNNTVPRKRKETHSSQPNPTTKPKKSKPKQQQEITIDNFI